MFLNYQPVKSKEVLPQIFTSYKIVNTNLFTTKSVIYSPLESHYSICIIFQMKFINFNPSYNSFPSIVASCRGRIKHCI